MSEPREILPMPVWVVIGAAIGGAIGSGGGSSGAGLLAGVLLGGAGGALVSFALRRRRGGG
jgi:hypothetical protein